MLTMEQFNGTNFQKKARIQSLKRDAKISNYFNQPIEDNDILLLSSVSAILLKRENDYFRCFIVSSDSDDLKNCLIQLNDYPIVINFPTKSPVDAFARILQDAGFSSYKKYIRLHNTNIKKRGILSQINYAVADDIPDILEILKSNFVDFLDYLPDREELSGLISKNNVIVNRNAENKVIGVMIFEMQGVKCYLRAWLDLSNNGLKLLYDVYTIMYEDACKYAYFWVDSDNTDVLKIHKLLSAVEDGLYDYIFVNNKLLERHG